MVGKIRRFAEANVPASSRRGAESAMARVGYAATIANERLGAVDAWLASRRTLSRCRAGASLVPTQPGSRLR